MARKLTPRIVTADEVSEMLAPSAVPAPRLTRRPEPGKLRTRANFADAILRLWTEAEENFLAIGRYLNHAKTVLDHGDFMGMVERDLPFRYSTANRLMKVAAAIDAGELPADRLPPSYATVYEMVLLNPDEREQAQAQGLISPATRRQDVIDFKKRLRASPATEEESDRRELARLEAERARIDARIMALKAKLSARR
ncbi:DUF3102 domain-containing protein [Azospirillum picis]|uniref:DUF3102 domain-containing protein n=1 Tax=Azospirillum picis TaxID=488438 RepID=A0ABU0MTG1_9PROT|nr:DUF3102 domain-containing protein [Azospirillum picis]MBP2302727.1 hypothetical protein [Azospirillum picis]MDQ0536478.1 hypothetical protein [Azospirillum picis]